MSDADLAALARERSSSALTYAQVGQTLGDAAVPGYHHIHREVELSGEGDVFGRAAEAIRQWRQHRGAGLRVVPAAPPAEGATVAVAIPMGPLTVVAPCRIVTVIDEPDRAGFVYGTLPGHPEQGEEAFVVRRARGGVWFTVTAFSRHADLLTRAAGLFTRAVQARTTDRYLRAIVDAVR